MMKAVTSSSVAVSLGSRVESASRRRRAGAPATITSPSTSRALANSEPRIAVWATTTSPALSANRTTNSSGRLPSVDCASPVAAGPKRSPTCSVARDTSHARPASARVASAKAGIGAQPEFADAGERGRDSDHSEAFAGGQGGHGAGASIAKTPLGY